MKGGRGAGYETLIRSEDFPSASARWVELFRRARRKGRFGPLLDLLERSPALRERVRLATASLLKSVDALAFFAEAGLPRDRGLLVEVAERLSDRLVPRPADERDLVLLAAALVRSDADAERFARMAPGDVARAADLVFPPAGSDAWGPIRDALADGFRILAARAEAQALSPRLRRRAPRRRVKASPFHRLARTSAAFLDAWSGGKPAAPAAAAWREEAEGCRRDLAAMHARLGEEGISLDVVYGIEVLGRILDRMERIVAVAEAPPGAARAAAAHRLVAHIAREIHENRSVRHLLGWNTRLLHRRIVDRSGETGEHYIATGRRDYRRMWILAAGGGLLTVGTAAVKMLIHRWHPAPFLEGLASGLNYAISFLLLQRFGLLLATKQPAMTAAALASILREKRGAERLEQIVSYAARICHSQLATALANVAAVSLGAFLFEDTWARVFGRGFLSREEAEEVYRTLSPAAGGTVFYAALTGGILWLASLAGGWFENWTACHHVAEGVARHPLRARLGEARLRRWSDALRRNAAGWGTNVSLGLMLGMTPALGRFLGAPLDVRHVTLSTGQLAVAAASLDYAWFGEGWFAHAAAGIATMFVLNLSVSFLLSLFTASGAYGLAPREVLDLLRRLTRRFLRRPWEFVLPFGAPGAPGKIAARHS